MTESELREMWKNGQGHFPAFPPGTRFSISAQDFIKSQGIEVRFTDDLLDGKDQNATNNLQANPAWDKPGVFPVVLEGPTPTCLECGQHLPFKPEYMTQIDADHFAQKTNPRLVLRGRVDSLHALVMLTASMARRFDLMDLAHHLDTLAAFCREIMSAEYNMRPTASLSLLGKSEDELHEISHWPEKHLGIPHIVPGAMDHEILHWLNVLRTQCREVEIVALNAFPPASSGQNESTDSIIKALNRLSSAV